MSFTQLRNLMPSRDIQIFYPADLSTTIRAQIPFVVPDPASLLAPDGAQTLKIARQRVVARIGAPFAPGGTLVAKMFPLRNPLSSLRHKKYAWREYANLQKALALGVQAPRTCAFFQRKKFGFVIGSGLLIEDLSSYRSVDLLAKLDGFGYERAAVAAIPALLSLFDLGINHIDARDENILLDSDGEGCGDFRIIDWQYATFHTPRADWLLEYLACWFIRKAPPENREFLLQEWLAILHQACGHKCDFGGFKRRVGWLLVKRPSTRDRLLLRAPLGGECE